MDHDDDDETKQQDLPNLETTAHRDEVAEGMRRKKEGQERVAENNVYFLLRMREKAAELVERTGSVTTDDLRRYAQAIGLEPAHPNAWGAVFAGRRWISQGRIRSTIPSTHARSIMVWRFRKEGE